MKITVNGEDKILSAPLTLGALLEEMGIDRRGVAVARNRDVVPRDAYETTALDDGDVLEVVRMVAAASLPYRLPSSIFSISRLVEPQRGKDT